MRRGRTFDVLDFDTEAGSAGIVVDATEAETVRRALTRLADAHRRTLDQLSTGVAMFDSGQRLMFYNDAYRTLWDLDAAVLDQRPSDSAVLDILRAGRKLPEERDFRQWKWQLHEAYRIAEPKDHTWHLPDGRTLRVITTPNSAATGGCGCILRLSSECGGCPQNCSLIGRTSRKSPHCASRCMATPRLGAPCARS